jgi:hypothetical protein
MGKATVLLAQGVGQDGLGGYETWAMPRWNHTAIGGLTKTARRRR